MPSPLPRGLACVAAPLLAACTSSAGSSPCAAGDSDGVNGGAFTFQLSVTDTGFAPAILKAQNRADVTLTLRNDGTRPHDLVFDCVATPNGDGCPTTSCFPDAAAVPALAPDASATVRFVTPNPEGIYVFRSDVGGDTAVAGDGGLAGQFIVQ